MKRPLTPIRFLHRAESQYGTKTGVIDGDESWTYSEYARRCRRQANLLESYRLPAGSVVAFLSFNTHQLLEGYYGVILAGHVFLPLNIRLSPADFTFILNDASVKVLFFHQAFRSVIEQIRPQLETVERFISLDSGETADWMEDRLYDQLLEEQSPQLQVDAEAVDEDSVAEMFYTSGTTSTPKGVLLTHRNLYLHALEVGLMLNGTDADVQLHTIPLFHVNGWGTPQLLTCLGGTHVMLPKFDPLGVLEQIQRNRVTLMSLVPTMATALIHHPERGNFDLSSLRRVTIGGSASNPKLIGEAEEAFGCLVVSGYGLTETSPVLTASFVKSHLKTDDADHSREIQAMTGYPIPGADLQIVDDDGRPLPWDGVSEGEIVVRGDMVMKGYYNRPEDNEKAFRGGWFHTGDRATINPDGYVLIVDRQKDIIISGGENISSIELEKVVLGHPAVLECAVIPIPDDQWGEVPKALVVCKPGRSCEEEELLDHCRTNLAGFKMPKSVDFFAQELPKGGTGKILKRKLRERYWAKEKKRVH